MAEIILPRPLFIYFVVCGAIFATATTLNAKIGTCTKPVLQACSDGWFPQKFATLHPKYKTPVYLLVVFYIVGLLPILFEFSIGAIASTVVLLAYIFKIILAYKVLELPKLFPEQWEKSPYKVGQGMLKVLVMISVIGISFQCYLLIMRASITQIVGTVIVFIAALMFAQLRYKYAEKTIEVSYEVE